MPTQLWDDLRWEQIREVREKGAAVVVPIGATEQHGPHMSLGVDTLCAYEVAIRGGDLVQEFPVLVTSPVPFGLSHNHIEFPGTITVGGEVLEAYVCDVCRSLWRHGFRHILLLNGHTGNIGALESATVTLAAEGILVATSTYWQIGGDDLASILKVDKGGYHAGEWETAVMLYLRPDAVDMTRAIKDLRRPGNRLAWAAWINHPSTDSGLYGDATVATAETGERCVRAHALRVAEFLRDWKSREIPDNWRVPEAERVHEP
ncbi:MAG: creatininase family protein [Chloroflexi bacterium]|nr:creatininase family protein [Chloroflexota bacterium]